MFRFGVIQPNVFAEIESAPEIYMHFVNDFLNSHKTRRFDLHRSQMSPDLSLDICKSHGLNAPKI